MIPITTTTDSNAYIGHVGFQKDELFEEDCTLDEARDRLNHIFKYQEDDLCEEDSPVTQRALSLLTAHPSLAFETFEVSERLNFQFLPLSIFIASGANLAIVALLHKLNPYAVCERHPDLKIYVSGIYAC